MRIVSLAPSNTEILFALGAGDCVVGATVFCDYPQEVKTLAKVGGWTTANTQMILALKPDLVITSTFLQKEASSRFKNLPFSHLHVDPKTMATVFESILQIGEVVERKKRAQRLVDKMKREMHLLQKKNTRKQPRIYIEEWHQPPMVSGNWVPEMVTIAGGKYFPIQPGSPSRAVSEKEVQAFDPEIILLSLCGFGGRPSKEIITRRKGWENLSAVKNDRVYVVDDSFFNRPGPRLVLGIKMLSKLIAGD